MGNFNYSDGQLEDLASCICFLQYHGCREEENKITWLLDYTEDDTATTSTEGFISSCKIVLVVSTLHISWYMHVLVLSAAKQ